MGLPQQGVFVCRSGRSSKINIHSLSNDPHVVVERECDR